MSIEIEKRFRNFDYKTLKKLFEKYNIQKNGFIDINNFKTELEPETHTNRIFDLRNGSKPFEKSSLMKRKGAMSMIF